MLKSDYEQKAKLIEFARALGQQPDQRLVNEVQAYLDFQKELRENARASIANDLKEVLASLKQEVSAVTVEDFPLPPSLDDLEQLIESTTEEQHDLDTETPQEISTTSSTAAPDQALAEQSLTDLVAQSITQSVKKDSFQQPDPQTVPADLVSITRKLKYLEQWLGKISLQGAGGGASDTSNFTTYTTSLTANTYTVARKDYYIGVNYDGEVTITLPTGYVEPGRGLIIKDESSNCSLNPITISGNVDNDGYGFVLQIDNGSVQLLYHNGWRII